MGIYSANRSGSMSVANIAANENYRSNDIGRILYESTVNDMAIFEATLANDFGEIRGLTEGTILESELKALNEASAKEFFAELKKKLLAFWAKIKGVFETAMQKVGYYILHSGKSTVQQFDQMVKKNKSAATKSFDVEVMVRDTEFKFENSAAFDNEKLYNLVEKYRGNNDSFDKNAVTEKILGEAIPGSNGSVSSKEFYSKVMEKSFKKVHITSINDSNIKDMKTAIVESSGLIKDLKACMKIRQMEIESLKRSLDKQERSIENAKPEEISRMTSIASAACSITETLVSQFTRVEIAIVKNHAKVSAIGLRKIINACGGLKESAELLVEAEADAELEELPGEDPATTDADVQELVNSVE